MHSIQWRKVAFVSAMLVLVGCHLGESPMARLRAGNEAYNRGLSAFRAQQWTQAEDAFAAVPKEHEIHAKSLSFRAQIAAEQGDIPRAVALMKEAEAVNPTEFERFANGAYAEIFTRVLIDSKLEQQAYVAGLFVDDALVFVHSTSGTVTAHDRAGLRPVWSFPFASASIGSVARGDGTISGFVDNHQMLDLVVLDSKTGKERFRKALGIVKHDDRGIIAADGARIFVATDDPAELHAFDASSGNLLWKKPLDGRPGPLTIAAGRIFLRTKAQTVYAFKMEDGNDIFTIGLPIGYGPKKLVATDTRLFVQGERGNVIALDATERVYEAPLQRILWETPADGSQFPSTPAAAFGKLWVPRRSGVEVYDIDTGKLFTKVKLGLVPMLTPDATANEVGGIVLVSYSHFILALDPRSGPRWIAQSSHPLGILGSTSISLDGRILAGGNMKGQPMLFTLNPSPNLTY